MNVTIANADIARLRRAIEGTGRKLRKELAIAVNQTATKGKSTIAKQISSELATTQKNIRSEIKQSKRAGDSDTTAELEVRKTGRIPLRDFGARQTRKGVSYRISKTKGRRVIAGAFQVTKWRGRVFKRLGKKRLPIKQRMGPSVWGVFVVGGKIGPSVQHIAVELKKNIDKRIRFIALKQSGAI